MSNPFEDIQKKRLVREDEIKQREMEEMHKNNKRKKAGESYHYMVNALLEKLKQATFPSDRVFYSLESSKYDSPRWSIRSYDDTESEWSPHLTVYLCFDENDNPIGFSLTGLHQVDAGLSSDELTEALKKKYQNLFE